MIFIDRSGARGPHSSPTYNDVTIVRYNYNNYIIIPYLSCCGGAHRDPRYITKCTVHHKLRSSEYTSCLYSVKDAISSIKCVHLHTSRHESGVTCRCEQTWFITHRCRTVYSEDHMLPNCVNDGKTVLSTTHTLTHTHTHTAYLSWHNLAALANTNHTYHPT